MIQCWNTCLLITCLLCLLRYKWIRILNCLIGFCHPKRTLMRPSSFVCYSKYIIWCPLWWGWAHHFLRILQAAGVNVALLTLSLLMHFVLVLLGESSGDLIFNWLDPLIVSSNSWTLSDRPIFFTFITAYPFISVLSLFLLPSARVLSPAVVAFLQFSSIGYRISSTLISSSVAS